MTRTTASSTASPAATTLADTAAPAVDASRMPGLDGVRALSVMAVVAYHTHPGWAALPMTSNTFLGVDAFFVLSGFLITTLLLRERAATGRISLGRFYARRALRIFPLYYALLAALTAYFAFGTGASTQRAAFLAALPWHATYLSNWVPTDGLMNTTWSLSTEEQFYLLWPPLLAWLRAWALLPLAAFLLANQAVNFGWLDGWFAAHGMPRESLEILQTTFAPILMGVLAAYALDHARGGAWLRHAMTGARVWLLALLLLVLLNIPGDLRGAPRLAIHVAMTALLLGLVAQPAHRLVRWLEWPPLVYVGVVSYGVYLLHKPGLDVAMRIVARTDIASREALFMLTMAVTLVLATVSWRLLEQPMLRLKARYRDAKVTDPSGA